MDADPTEGYLRRAELLADLGRFDEAAAELDLPIARDPGNGEALALLAAIHLAAGRPEPGLAVAERAVAATPGALPPLVAQGVALCELRRFKEAAAVAARILAAGPHDPYAQLHGAAILGEARNGQPALDAAWHAVSLAPDDARAHLVLAGIAARLQLADLAERAYGEALRLDPTLSSASGHLRRYAGVAADIAPRPAAGDAIARLAFYAGGFTVVAAVLVATLHLTSPTDARVLGAVLGAVGLAGVGYFAAKLRRPLSALVGAERAAVIARYAALAGPALILLYALTGSPWPLAGSIAATAVAGVAIASKIRF
jgi:tetratricopeptide (TPR) repeat protein